MVVVDKILGVDTIRVVEDCAHKMSNERVIDGEAEFAVWKAEKVFGDHSSSTFNVTSKTIEFSNIVGITIL
jgi:hypothetical protein